MYPTHPLPEPLSLPDAIERERAIRAALHPTPRLSVRPLRDICRDMVEAALEQHGGATEACAAALGICRKTLYSKVHAYGLERVLAKRKRRA